MHYFFLFSVFFPLLLVGCRKTTVADPDQDDAKKQAKTNEPPDKPADKFNVHAQLMLTTGERFNSRDLETFKDRYRQEYKKWANKPDGRAHFFKEHGFHELTFNGTEEVTHSGKVENGLVEYSFAWGKSNGSPADTYRNRRPGMLNPDGSTFSATDLKKVLDYKAKSAKEGKLEFNSVTIGGELPLEIGKTRRVCLAIYTIDQDRYPTTLPSQVSIYQWMMRSTGERIDGKDKTIEVLK